MRVIYLEATGDGTLVHEEGPTRIEWRSPSLTDDQLLRGHVAVFHDGEPIAEWFSEALEPRSPHPRAPERSVEGERRRVTERLRIIEAMAMRLLRQESARRLMLDEGNDRARVFRLDTFEAATNRTGIALPSFEDLAVRVLIEPSEVRRVEYLRIGPRTGSMIFSLSAPRVQAVGVEPGAVLMRIFHADPESAYRLGAEREPERQ